MTGSGFVILPMPFSMAAWMARSEWISMTFCDSSPSLPPAAPGEDGIPVGIIAAAAALFLMTATALYTTMPEHTAMHLRSTARIASGLAKAATSKMKAPVEDRGYQFGEKKTIAAHEWD